MLPHCQYLFPHFRPLKKEKEKKGEKKKKEKKNSPLKILDPPPSARPRNTLVTVT